MSDPTAELEPHDWIRLGSLADALAGNEAWELAKAMVRADIAREILNSAPGEMRTREELYYEHKALTAILSRLARLIAQGQEEQKKLARRP